jgi:hypothetical protein
MGGGHKKRRSVVVVVIVVGIVVGGVGGKWTCIDSRTDQDRRTVNYTCNLEKASAQKIEGRTQARATASRQN